MCLILCTNRMKRTPCRRANAKPGSVKALLSSFGLRVHAEKRSCPEITSPLPIPLQREAVSLSQELSATGSGLEKMSRCCRRERGRSCGARGSTSSALAFPTFSSALVSSQGPQGEPGPPGQQGNPGAQVRGKLLFHG